MDLVNPCYFLYDHVVFRKVRQSYSEGDAISSSTLGRALKAIDRNCRVSRLIRKGAEGPACQLYLAVGEQQK